MRTEVVVEVEAEAAVVAVRQRGGLNWREDDNTGAWGIVRTESDHIVNT